MERIMKKLLVVVTTIAISIIMAAAWALAGGLRTKGIPHKNPIQGVYGWTGPVRCISADGFSNELIPEGTPVTMSTTSQGTITFKRDGTGVVEFTGFTTTDPPGNPPNNVPGASLFKASYAHTYEVSDGGLIGIYGKSLVQTFESGLVITIETWDYTGYISTDHKTIVIATPKPVIQELILNLPAMDISIGKVICHASHTLVRLSD